MKTSWIISALCLVILGSALLADAQIGQNVYHPAAANPPNQFQVVRAVGSASDNLTTNYNAQTEFWLNFQQPINIGNLGAAVGFDYGVDVSPNTSLVSTKFRCVDVTGVKCPVGASYSTWNYYPQNYANPPSGGNLATYDLRLYSFNDNPSGGQGFTTVTPYTFTPYTVTVYGEGTRGTAANPVKAGLTGTPAAPTSLASSYLTPTSFVLSWIPPSTYGQAPSATTTGPYQLVSPYFEVQIRLDSAKVTIGTAGTLLWYPVNASQIGSLTFGNASTGTAYFGATESATVAAYSTSSAYPVGNTGLQQLVPNTTYDLRVRAMGQFGAGLWSSKFLVTTADSWQSANPVLTTVTQVSSASNGGLYSWNTNFSSGAADNIIGGYGNAVAAGTPAYISGFTVQFSCVDVSQPVNFKCPTTELNWKTTGQTPTLVWGGISVAGVTPSTGGQRVTGGYVVIDNSTNPVLMTANTLLNYYVTVFATVSTTPGNSAATTTGTFQAAAQWKSVTFAGQQDPVSWGGSGFSLGTCWGVGSGTTLTTACQGTFAPPATIGGGGFSAFAILATGTAKSACTAVPVLSALTFIPSQLFYVSAMNVAGTVDITAQNTYGATQKNAVIATGTPTTVVLASATSNPDAGVIQTRSGAAIGAGTSFIMQGKNSNNAANGWVAIRVARPYNTTNGTGANSSATSSSNSATTLGNLTWNFSLDTLTIPSGAQSVSGTSFLAAPSWVVGGGAYAATAANVITTSSITYSSNITAAGTAAANNVTTTAGSGCTAMVVNPAAGTGITGVTAFMLAEVNAALVAVPSCTAAFTAGAKTYAFTVTGGGIACTTVPIVTISVPASGTPTYSITAGANQGSKCTAINSAFSIGTGADNNGNTMLTAGTVTVTLTYALDTANAGTPAFAQVTALTATPTAIFTGGNCVNDPIAASNYYGAGAGCTGATLPSAPAGFTGGGAVVMAADISTTTFALTANTAKLTTTPTSYQMIKADVAGWNCTTYPKVTFTAASNGGAITGVTITAGNQGSKCTVLPTANVVFGIANVDAGDFASGTVTVTLTFGLDVVNVTIPTTLSTTATNTTGQVPFTGGTCTTMPTFNIAVFGAAVNISSVTFAPGQTALTITGGTSTYTPVIYTVGGGTTSSYKAASLTITPSVLTPSFVLNNPTTGVYGVALLTLPSIVTTNNLIAVQALTSNYASGATGSKWATSSDKAVTASVADPGVALSSFTVVDITDTSAVFLFGFKDNTLVTSADLNGTTPGYNVALSFVSKVGVTLTPACTPLSNSNDSNSGDLNTLYQSYYTCYVNSNIKSSVPTTPNFLPGWKYTVTGGVSYTQNGTTTSSTSTSTFTFWTASQRTSKAVRTPTLPATSTIKAPANVYYYATATAFNLWYQPPTDNLSVGAASAGFAASGFTSYLIMTQNGSQTNTARYQLPTQSLDSTSYGSWQQISVSSAGTDVTSAALLAASVKLTVSVTLNTSIAAANAADSIAVTMSTATAATAATTFPLPGSTQRYLTDNTVWLEFEGPSDIGFTSATPAAPFNVWKKCTGTSPDTNFVSITGSSTASATGANASNSLNPLNYILVTATSILTAGQTGPCNIAMSYNNGKATDAAPTDNSKWYTVTFASGVPSAPTISAFDQITTLSSSFLMLYANSLGASSTAPTWTALAAADCVVNIKGDTRNWTPAFDTNTPNKNSSNTAPYNYNFQQLGMNYLAGYWTRIVSLSTIANSITTNANLFYSTTYSVSCLARNGLAAASANQASSQSSQLAATTPANGDLPDVPTNLSSSRITNAGVRLHFTRPLNVGGAPLSTVSTQFSSNVANAVRIWVNPTTTPVTAAPYVPATYTQVSSLTTNVNKYNDATANLNPSDPNVTWSFDYFVDITYPSPAPAAGTSYTFYIGFTNQYSQGTQFTPPTSVSVGKVNANDGNYDPSQVSTSAILNQFILVSTTASITSPPATGNGSTAGSVTNGAVLASSNAYVSLIWNEPVTWGSAAVTNYQITRSPGAAATPSTPLVQTQAVTTFGGKVLVNFIDTNSLSTNTKYTYTVVALVGTTAGASATIAATTDVVLNTTTTPNTIPSTPGAPNTPVNNQLTDTLTSLYWLYPQDQGGTAATGPNTPNFTNTKVVQSFVPGAEDPGAKSACDLTYTFSTTAFLPTAVYWTSVAYSFTTLPGKTYVYKSSFANSYTTVVSMVTTTTVQSGPTSGTTASILANYIQRPYPYPVLTCLSCSTGTSTSVSPGYVTFALSYTDPFPDVLSPFATGGPTPLAGTSYTNLPYIGFQIASQNTGITGSNGSTPTGNATAGLFAADTYTTVANAIPGYSASVSYPVNGLFANTVYRFKAVTYNGFANSVRPATSTTVDTDLTITTALNAKAPGQVITLQSNIFQKRTTSINLQWDTPLESGGRGIIGTYRIQYSATGAPGNSTSYQNSTSTAQLFGVQTMISGLGGSTNGTSTTSYYVSVFGSNGLETSSTILPALFTGASAVGNGGGTGSNLNQVVLGQIPNYPTNLAVSSSGSGNGTSATCSGVATCSIPLTWSAPPSAGSSVVTGYQFQIETIGVTGVTGGVSSGNSLSSITSPSGTLTTTFTTGSGNLLNAAGLARITVQAVNAVSSAQNLGLDPSGQFIGPITGGEISQPLIFQLPVITPVPNPNPTPAQPQSLTLQYYNANEYRLSWSDPNSVASVNPASHYVVSYWTIFSRLVSTGQAAGSGNVLINQAGDLQYQQVGSVTTAISTFATCNQIFSSIRPSTRYMVTVAGAEKTGTYLSTFTPFIYGASGAFAVVAQPLTATAAAPTSLAVANGAISNNAYTMTFAAPAYTGMDNIFNYVITTYPEYGGTPIVGNVIVTQKNVGSRSPSGTCVVGGATCTYTQDGLTAGTNYVVNVRAQNSFGPSIPSQNIRVTTTGGSGFTAQTSFWTLVLLALASVLVFVF